MGNQRNAETTLVTIRKESRTFFCQYLKEAVDVVDSVEGITKRQDISKALRVWGAQGGVHPNTVVGGE